MQTDAGHQNRRHRHQGDHHTGWTKCRANDCALILAEQLGDAVEGDRIDIPRVAGNISDLVDSAVVWRMEAVIHTGCQPQSDVLAIAIELDEVRIDQQILQAVGKSLGLDHLAPVDPPAGADDGITGTGQVVGIAVDGTRAGFQLSREARVQARKALRPSVAQVEIRESPPDRDRRSRQQRRLDLTEPLEKAIREMMRDAIGQQETEVLPQEGLGG
jgi:hypothetical protein